MTDVNSITQGVGARDLDYAAGLRDGDERAFELAYREHGATVRNYVRRFVTVDEADDLTQQTFLELWRFHDRLDVSKPVLGFILGIARKRSIDHLRRRRHDVVDVNAIRSLMSTEGDALVDQLVWAAEVEHGLATLVAEQREVLVLAHFEDLTQVEIAERLGIPLGTVKARMARGMKKLAEKIERGDLL